MGTLDRQDERLNVQSGLKGELRATRQRIRNGEIGSLPVIVGLIIIAVVFQVLNPFFLSSSNLVNIALESAPVGTIAVGIVLVLLLGQIDLSVGSVAGLSAAILAVGMVNLGWPMWMAMAVPILAGALIGACYGFLFVRFGVPSFVITLSGLLAVLGMQLYVLGTNGSINIPFDSFIVEFAQSMFLPPVVSYVLVILIAVAFVVFASLSSSRRRNANLSAPAPAGIYIRGALVLVGLLVITWYLNLSRGVAVMFVFFLAVVAVTAYALNRTRWGRAVYAVGGNVEAARRTGIRVTRTYISVFILCSTLAAVGGLMLAGRLASASPSTGGGDTNLNAIAAAVIGGTSLFGGRGSAQSALLGILVISSMSSGLTLLNLDSSIRYILTGAVLLIAVIIDSVSRQSRKTHGRA